MIIEPPAAGASIAHRGGGGIGTAAVASANPPTNRRAAERGNMPRRRSSQPTPAEPTLEGMPAAEPQDKPPTAGDLVAAWCKGWTASHDGAQPDPSVVRRVAGICRAVAKDRTDMDSWRDAWRAAIAAGRAGRYDIVSQLAAPAMATGRGNHYLTLARGHAEAALPSQASALAQAFGQTPIALPPAAGHQ